MWQARTAGARFRDNLRAGTPIELALCRPRRALLLRCRWKMLASASCTRRSTTAARACGGRSVFRLHLEVWVLELVQELVQVQVLVQVLVLVLVQAQVLVQELVEQCAPPAATACMPVDDLYRMHRTETKAARH